MINGFPDYRLVRDSKRDFHVESNKKGDWEEVGSHRGDGHIQLELRGDNVRRNTFVHVLVAEMFVPNPEGKDVVHHIDFDATNNDPANLLWLTQSEHMKIHSNSMTEETRKKMSDSHKGKKHSEETKRKIGDAQRGEKSHMYGKHQSEEWKMKILLSHRKPVEQWSKDGTTLIARYESIAEAARQTGVDAGNISRCCLGKYKTAGGYRWRYSKEET